MKLINQELQSKFKIFNPEHGGLIMEEDSYGEVKPVIEAFKFDDFFSEDEICSNLCFRDKAVIISGKTAYFYFQVYENMEIWLLVEKKVINNQKKFSYQWISVKNNDLQKISRKVKSKELLDVKVKGRDQEITKSLKQFQKKGEEIEDFIDDLGIFLDENKETIFQNKKTFLETSYEDLGINSQEDFEEEITPEEREELENILKMEDLFHFIDSALYEKKDQFIIGEFNSKFTLTLNCIGAALGIDTINTLKSGSSIGKTTVADVVSNLFKTKRMGHLTETALKYMDLENFDILYFQETTEDEFGKKEVRLLSGDDGGFKAEITVKDPETNEYKVIERIIPVKTIITTTTSFQLDPEFASRNFILPMDDSADQTKRIVNENFDSSEKKIKELKGEKHYDIKYQKLKKAFRLLKPYEVIIPFESELKTLFPKYEPRARRDSKKLIKLIKECALMFQYQRDKTEINGKEVLIADILDLFYVIEFCGLVLEATLSGFDSRLISSLPIVYELIENEGYVTSKKLSMELVCSYKYAWQILKTFEDAGLIFHDEDTKEELGIKGRTKVYVKKSENQSEDLLSAIRNIDWVKLQNKSLEWIKEQIPNFKIKNGKNIAFIPYFDKDEKVSVKKIDLFQNQISRIKSKKGIESDLSKIKQDTNLIGDYRTVNEDELLNAAYNALKKHTKEGLYPVEFQNFVGNNLNIEEDKVVIDLEIKLIESGYILQEKPGDHIFPAEKLINIFKEDA